MKHLTWIAVASFASFAFCLGCQERTEPAKEQAPTKEQAPSPPVATVTPAATVSEHDLEAVPTEEDFEEQAEKEITSENLEKKLDELEKEIESE